MSHKIHYLNHPLHTVNAKEAERLRIAEAMAAFGTVEIVEPAASAPRRTFYRRKTAAK